MSWQSASYAAVHATQSPLHSASRPRHLTRSACLRRGRDRRFKLRFLIRDRCWKVRVFDTHLAASEVSPECRSVWRRGSCVAAVSRPGMRLSWSRARPRESNMIDHGRVHDLCLSSLIRYIGRTFSVFRLIPWGWAKNIRFYKINTIVICLEFNACKHKSVRLKLNVVHWHSIYADSALTYMTVRVLQNKIKVQ